MQTINLSIEENENLMKNSTFIKEFIKICLQGGKELFKVNKYGKKIINQIDFDRGPILSFITNDTIFSIQNYIYEIRVSRKKLDNSISDISEYFFNFFESEDETIYIDYDSSNVEEIFDGILKFMNRSEQNAEKSYITYKILLYPNDYCETFVEHFKFLYDLLILLNNDIFFKFGSYYEIFNIENCNFKIDYNNISADFNNLVKSIFSKYKNRDIFANELSNTINIERKLDGNEIIFCYINVKH